MDFSGGVVPPDDKASGTVMRVGACLGAEVMATGDEEIQNPRGWVFHLDTNVILGDGTSWKSGSRVFHP